MATTAFPSESAITGMSRASVLSELSIPLNPPTLTMNPNDMHLRGQAALQHNEEAQEIARWVSEIGLLLAQRHDRNTLPMDSGLVTQQCRCNLTLESATPAPHCEAAVNTACSQHAAHFNTLAHGSIGYYISIKPVI